MTAPGNPMEGMLQTLMFLRQERDRKRQLALQEQIAGTQRQATETEMFGQFQRMLQNSVDPKQYAGQVEEIARLTGRSPQLITQAMNNTAPAVPTQQAAAVQGVMQDPKMRQRVGMAATGIGTPGEMAKDELYAQMYGDETEFYNRLPKDRKDKIVATMLEKGTSGMTLGEAALDAEVAHMTPEERKQAVLVGKGLAPSAPQDAQIRQGWAQIKIAERNADIDAARLGIAAMEAGADKDEKVGKEITEILKERRQLMAEMVAGAATQTPEGVESHRAQLNAYNQRLRELAPQVYGTGDKTKGIPPGTMPLFDIAPKKQLSTSTLSESIEAWLKRRQ